MQIIESLILEQDGGSLDTLLELLPVESVIGHELPIKRLEVNPDLIVMFYIIRPNREIKSEIIDRVFPHLKSVLVLSGGDEFSEANLPMGCLDRFKSLNKNCLVITAAKVNNAHFNSLPIILKHNGFYLDSRSRLIPWCEENKESHQNVWQSLWGILDEPN